MVDLLDGRLLRTPNALGRVLFSGDATPPAGRELGAVLGYTVVQFILFAVVGIGVVKLVHLATRHLILRMGIWIGLVIAFLFFNGWMFVLSRATGERFGWWAILGGSAAAVAAMIAVLWRRHPALAYSLRRVGLGDAEARNPPAPPGGPRVYTAPCVAACRPAP